MPMALLNFLIIFACRDMNLIDTHCHLYLDEFAADITAVIERARAEGVSRFYLPAIDSDVIENMLQLEEKFHGACIAMMGLHPCSVKENYKEELSLAEQWLDKRKFAAIGEIGLDFYWDKTFTPQQYDAFKRQVSWAKQYKIPVVIHSRESTQACIDVIKEMQDADLTGIFHCFGGSLEEAQQYMAMKNSFYEQYLAKKRVALLNIKKPDFSR